MSLLSGRTNSARTRTLQTDRSIELFHRDLSMPMALRCAVEVALMLIACCSVDTRLDKTQEPVVQKRKVTKVRWSKPIVKVDQWVGVPSCDGVLLRKLRLQNVWTDVAKWGWALFCCKGPFVLQSWDDMRFLKFKIIFRIHFLGKKEAFQFETDANQTRQTVWRMQRPRRCFMWFFKSRH